MAESLIVIVKEEGVKDLPVAARRYFALALKNEREGDDAQAAVNLDKAIEEEAKATKK